MTTSAEAWRYKVTLLLPTLSMLALLVLVMALLLATA